jgi:hypothetical protein
MPPSSFDYAAEVRQALAAIVSDPRHGIDALSRPQLMANILTDLLPDAPRETGVLIAAARAGVVDMLREHVDQGMDARTAMSLAIASFANTTAFTADACTWVTAEFAIALGLDVRDSAADLPGAVGGAATEAAAPADQQQTVDAPQVARPGDGPQPDGQLPPAAAVTGLPRADTATAEGDIPPMPLLESHELWFEPTAIVEGGRYSIGWQRWMSAYGGPQFVTLRRTMLGTYKAVERFPLTAEGWSAAWRALADLEPATSERARRALRHRAEAERQSPKHAGTPAVTPVRDARPDQRPGQSPAAPIDELTRLAKLLDSGLLTRREFEQLKARLIE